jgi:L-alanine-DL-glutamate epimerase-like enolase superfamily enzyme
MMKITGIDIIPVSIPKSRALKLSTYGSLGEKTFDYVLTKIYTDEEIFGVGDCPPLPPLSPESQSVIVAKIKNWLAPQLIGEDPFNLEKIWEKMDFVAPTYPMSKAVLDLAIYDIMGKALDTPVYNLLGGSYQKKIPIVGLIGIGSEEEISADAVKFLEAGYTGLRLKIGPKRDVTNIKTLRDIADDDITIRVDCNQGYSVSEAITVIKAMERYNVELVEQPTVWWDFKALATIAKAVDIPIMPHESIYLLSDVKSLVELGAVGVLGLKMYRPGGGITNAKRLIDMARLMDIPCLIHDDIELGVSLAAATHFITARYNDLKFKAELSGYPEWLADDIVKHPLEIQNGCVEVPKGAGFGVELDEDKIKKYSVDKISL